MSWQEYEEYRPRRPTIRFGPKLTPVVKVLIIINVLAFLVTIRALTKYYRTGIMTWPIHLCLVPHFLSQKGFLWQLVSHMFLHGGILHLILNMFILWMFGSDLEARLGRRQFLQLYFVSGIGAGLCHAVASWGSRIPMLGASGAICGVLIAFAMLFPERYVTLLLFFVFPVTLKAKHLVMGFAALQLLAIMSATRGGIAYYAHLGGFIFGYIYMKSRFRLSLPFAFAQRFSDSLKRRWNWRKRPKYRYTPIDVDEFISEEVDPILAKISRHGIGSLTRKEKRILRKARSQMK